MTGAHRKYRKFGGKQYRLVGTYSRGSKSIAYETARGLRKQNISVRIVKTKKGNYEMYADSQALNRRLGRR